MPEERATKYTQEEINALGAKGHAFKNPDGHYSYPVDDAEDLDDAIQAVGRSGAEHDSVRKYIMGRAQALGLQDKIPADWGDDGSISEAKASTKTCSTCDGSGKIKAGTTTCPTCDGTGKVAGDAKAAPDFHVVREPAPAAFRGEMLQVREERVPVRREFELREVPNGTGGTNLKFTGFACVTDARYEMEDWLGLFGETVSKGAFQKTLSEGADTAFLLNHVGMTLARTKPGTMKLAEVTEPGLSPVIGVTGLHTEALFDPQNMYVAAMRSAVDRGDLDEMSFAFRVMRQEWNDAYDERFINEVSVDKGDVSLVNYGANPHTGGTVDMRQRLQPRGARLTFAAVSSAITELRAGKTISAATAGTLSQAFGHLDQVGDSAENVRSLIAGLIAGDNGDGCGCCDDCTDDCDGSCCDACDMGPSGDSESDGASLSLGLVPDFRADRARVAALRHLPRREAA